MSHWGCVVLIAVWLTSTCAARVLAQASNRSYDGGFNVVGEMAGGDMPADGEASVSSSSTASEPAPFGGPWNSRPKLTGDWGGLREQLRDHGFTFDISSTTYYQGIASGGLEDTFQFGGRNDYLLNVDGQKAGLWQGFWHQSARRNRLRRFRKPLHRSGRAGEYRPGPSGLFRRPRPLLPLSSSRKRSRKTSSCTAGRSIRLTTSSNRSCPGADSMPAS